MSVLAGSLAIWTIYRNPSDYPGKYVVRRTQVSKSKWINDSEPAAVVGTLEEARAAVPPGLAYVTRHPMDDPVIVECWL